MLPANSKTVSILRPHETSWESFVEQIKIHPEYRGDGTDAYNPYVDDNMTDFRERISAVSHEIGVYIHIREVQLPAARTIPGRRVRRMLKNSNVVATMDPEEEIMALINVMSDRLRKHVHLFLFQKKTISMRC